MRIRRSVVRTGKRKMHIKYVFSFENGIDEVFDLKFDNAWEHIIEEDASALPAWTELEYNKCPNCPISSADRPRCPAAVSLVDFAKRLGKIVSFEKVQLAVLTDERWVVQNTTAQRAMGSLMGLLLATSGCPITAYMRPMARFHLPLSNDLETAYRAVGMYLVGQYLRYKTIQDSDFNLKGLINIYDELHEINIAIAQRLKDSGVVTEVNALVMLDLFAQGIPNSIEDRLPEFDYLFSAYTTQDR